MSRQTSVSNNPQTAYEGQVDGDAISNVIITKIANPSSGLSAGRGIKYVSGSDTKCDLPGGSTDITDVTKFLGVTIFQEAMTGSWPTTATTGIYQQGQLVSILKRGFIWVFAEVAVALTDTVYCRYTAGSFSVIGRFTNTSDSSSAAAVPTAKFATSTTGAGLVKLAINLI